jgi:capsular polysaccharide transport system permease protein
MFDTDQNQSFAKNSLQPQPVKAAKTRFRHFALLLSFVVMVVAPVAVAGWYLTQRAADQFASRVGFSVRTQEVEMPTDVLGGLGALSSGATRDSDILYEFIQSQEIVARVDDALDLRARFSVPANDPIFRFDPSAPIEDLVKFWRRMVGVYYDSGTGLIELRVRAFSSEDAVEIAQETLSQASLMINRLSAIARNDTTRYARIELDDAVARLKTARQGLTQFRVAQNIVDPKADVQVQMSLLGSLQQQLAGALIDLDLMLESTREADPRVANLRRRVAIIEQRIQEERGKFGAGQNGAQAFSELIAVFETLSVDLEFAQTSYLAALAGYDKAVRQAQQQSRYLAAYLAPTRPESAEFPQRALLLGLTALFTFLGWAILTLIYYSVRDRR